MIVRIDRDNTVWLNDREIPSEQELLVQLRAVRHGSSNANKMLVLGNSEAKSGTRRDGARRGHGSRHGRYAIGHRRRIVTPR